LLDAHRTRGYYVVFSRPGRVFYRRFGLTELDSAQAEYHALAADFTG